MPRKRMIDPEFWSDEEIGHWTHSARLFYIGLWNFADDEGRFKAHGNLLKSQIFPYDTKIDIENLKKEISKKIDWYDVDGAKYGSLRNFLKHQRIDKPTPSKLPPPQQFAEQSPNTLGLVDEESRLREEKRSKEKLREEKLSYSGFEETTLTTWNSFCDKNPILSKVKEISGKRRTALKNRFTQQSFLEFGAILAAAQEQPFCMGKNDRSWKISFDWLIANDTNFLKVLEYKYSDQKGKPEYQPVNPDCKVCAGKGVVYNQSTSSTVVCSCRIKKA